MSTDESNINPQERHAETTAGLGVILSEHEKWDIAEKESHYWAVRCQCGEWVSLHRQHVAAVVLAHLTAEGWREPY